MKKNKDTPGLKIIIYKTAEPLKYPAKERRHLLCPIVGLNQLKYERRCRGFGHISTISGLKPNCRY